MVLRQSQFDALLTPVIYHHFMLGQTMVPALRARLFTVRTSTLAQEKGTGMGGMPTAAWDAYRQTGQKGNLTLDQLYTQSYTHVEYPVRLPIQKKLIINDQYGMIQRIVQQAGISAEVKMEVDGVSLLNNAFTTTWGDGVALCSNSHPASPHRTGSTQDNLGTDALTATSLSATRIAMMRFTDDRGNLLGLMPNELWVPPELEDTALKITRSINDPGNANNDINPQAGRWQVIVHPRLTDTNNWFVVDGTWRQQVANWYEREALQIEIVDEDTTDIVYEMKLHYSFGVDDWRWIYGHQVA
jgi:phage major head subunit gpT-like protein